MTVSYFGETNFHNRFTRFGIKQADRLSHIYLLGKTGVGKSTLIEALARQDLEGGRGFCVIDPDGDLAERMRDAATAAGRPFVYMMLPHLTSHMAIIRCATCATTKSRWRSRDCSTR